MRYGKSVNDTQPEARQILDSEMDILCLLSRAICIAGKLTRVIDRAFGHSCVLSHRLPRSRDSWPRFAAASPITYRSDNAPSAADN